MRRPVVIIGLGQMGGLFAHGFLRIGYPVFPVLRNMSIQDSYAQIKDPAFVLVAVGEDELVPVLAEMPDGWNEHIGLLQNELLPIDWEKHGIKNPTVISVWFEKKFRSPITPLIASPVHGPKANLLFSCLSSLEIPIEILEDEEALVTALVMKNLYILTANITGLKGADTVGGLIELNPELTEAVFADVLAIQEALTDKYFDRGSMWQELKEIFRAQPDHGARGRSALQRLERAIVEADSHNLEVPALRGIAAGV